MHVVFSVNPDCTSAGLSTASLRVQPSQGTVEFTPVNEFPNFPSSNPRSKCNDQRIPGIGVFYTSNPAFRGTDQFTMVNVTPGGFRHVWPFQVVVE